MPNSIIQNSNTQRVVIASQGLYYAVTGVWPLLHRGSFEFVTGPKVDWWLVQMVGALTLSIGIAFLVSARRGMPAPELLILLTVAPLSYFAIDVIYARNNTIAAVYLLDAIIQAALIIFWTRALWLRVRSG